MARATSPRCCNSNDERDRRAVTEVDQPRALTGGLRPLLLDQFAAEDLAGGRFRNRRDKLDFADFLVRRNPLFDEAHELFRARFLALAEEDEGLRHLARLGVALRDTGRVHDGGVLHEERLELGRGDLIALVLDHFLLAIEDSDITFLVALDDVARPNPAAAGQWFGRIPRPLPGALHHLRAERQQLAYLADTKLTPVIESDNLLDRVG